MNPEEDGVTHINIYSRGKTELGKLLSNFAHTPFTHTCHGRFESVEGYWYWRKFKESGVGKNTRELFRTLHGFTAKQVGQVLSQDYVCYVDQEFNGDVLEAIRCKLRQNKHLLSLLTKSNLPLVHYYNYGGKVKLLPEYDWMVDEVIRIRKIMQERR